MATTNSAPDPTPQTSPSKALEAALGFANRGWAAVPVPKGKKAPRQRGWQNLRLTEVDLPDHFRNGNNVGLLLGEPSKGLVDVDLDTPEARAVAGAFLPATGMTHGHQTHPGSHRWYLADPIPRAKKFSDLDGTCLAELRSTGQQTLVPPSIHPSGERLRWESEGEPAAVNAAHLLSALARVAAAALLARHWPAPGSRHEVALALAGLLLRAGWSVDETLKFMPAVAQAAHDEEWRARNYDIFSTAKRLAQDGAATARPRLAELIGKEVVDRVCEWLDLSNGTAGQQEASRLTDLGNARRLVARHGRDLHYCPQWGKWFVWDGTRWVVDDTGEVERKAKETVQSIYAEAGAGQDDEQRRKLAQWAMRSESLPRIRAMLELAKSEPGIPVAPKELDANPYLLNCPNGTLDLRSGQLREHRREDLCTKQVPVEYDPTVACPTWEAFLDRILAGNRDLIAFLQRTVGYALTGDTSEQVLFFLYGTGANGKTTFLESLRFILGDYAQQADSNSFLTRQGEAVRNDLARLAGTRFVSAIEVQEGRHLAEVLIKQVTGGDTITARFLYHEYFEFRPQFKLFFAANHKPVIRGTDNAIWRRIRLIPFNETIPPEEQDKKLPERLRAEAAGILRWAVEGCLAWQLEALSEPPAVRDATADYREEMDLLAEFLEDCCILAPEARATARELYEAYKKWCEATGEKPLSQKTFGTKLRDRGLKRDQGGPGGRTRWLGIRLAEPT